jgi:hypothetical protein
VGEAALKLRAIVNGKVLLVAVHEFDGGERGRGDDGGGSPTISACVERDGTLRFARRASDCHGPRAS